MFTDILPLALLGLFAGLVGGLLGLGGSVVIIPGLIILLGGQDQHKYQAAAMIVNACVILPAAWRHWREGRIFPQITRWTIPTSVIGVVAGVYVSELPVFRGPGQGWLQILFGLLLTYVIIYNLKRLAATRKFAPLTPESAAAIRPWKIVTLVGLPSGLLGGLLGVGGGVLSNIGQQIGLRIPLATAISNTTATILWSSAVGAVFKNAHLHRHGVRFSDSLSLAAMLIPTAMLGSWIASAKVHRWPINVIRLAFTLVIAYCALRDFQSGWSMVGL